MYKAVFIDIDGTLIKTDHTISKATFDIIQKLKEKNILIVLVSARPLHGILPIADEIELMSFPIASLNGACIAIDGKIIFESTIDVATTFQLHDQLQQYNVTTIYFEAMRWFAEFRNYYTDYEQKITAVPIIIQPFASIIECWQNKNTGPNKILGIAEAEVIKEIQYNLKHRFINQLNIDASKQTYLEIMNIEACKMNAVNFLINCYNIKREETIAIGDNFNDKEMIEFAGIGIAMGNAPDEVKAAADYVTDTNNNDGIPKALAKFMDLQFISKTG
jgi:Cof subfamily protein (haloacid dehalogenase superfamily)